MKLKLFALSLVTLILTSCGSSEAPKPIIVEPAQLEIKGDLKGSFEVVDKKFKVYKEYNSYVVQVELKRTEAELPYDRKDITIYPEAKESNKSNIAGFGIEVLDSLGTVIAKIEANANPYSWDEMKAALQLLPGETATINFHIYDSLYGATKYRVTSLVESNTNVKSSKGVVEEFIDEAFDEAEKEAAENIKDAVETTKDLIEVEKKLLDLL